MRAADFTDLPTRSALVAREHDGKLIVHDDLSGSTHCLNAAARVIWERCDGTHDSAAIASAVAAHFDASPADVASDVRATLAHFRDVGLLLSPTAAGPEAEFLLDCVRTAIGTRPPEPLNPHGVDWNVLVQVALRHGVMPLLVRGLRTSGRDVVPPLVRDRLRRQYQANARASRVALRELLEILAAFEADGIRALPLKGPLMARSLYGSTALRKSGDLDLFVQPKSVARARHLLMARGYSFRRTRDTDAEAERDTLWGTVTVDLHWALSMPEFRFPLHLDDVWPRLQPATVAGATVFSPEPGDELMILCAHAAKHCWWALVWIADIAMFLRTHQHTLDWAGLLKRARRAGGERQLLLGLRLAHDVLGANVPQVVARPMMADARVHALCAELRQRLFAPVPPRSYQGSYGFVEGGLLYMKTKERFRDRVPYALEFFRKAMEWLVTRATPNVHDRAVVSLPRYLGFLYYPIRVWRLSRRAGIRLRQRQRASTVSLGAGASRQTTPT